MDGGVGDHSELDPGFRLRLAAPSKNAIVPKVEPMALTRGFIPGPRRFLPRTLPLNRPNIYFRVRVGPGAYDPRSFHPKPPFVPEDFIPRRPYVNRRPILPVHIVNVPTNSHRDVIFVHDLDRFQPGLRPGFRPEMNNGPHYPIQIPPGFHPVVNGPVHWAPRHPRPGANMRPNGLPPRQPNHGRPVFNQANNKTRDGDQKKDMPEGTVGVTVAAINQTEQGSVHANVTVFVVPKEGHNKETLQTNIAQSVIDSIFKKHKDGENK